VKITMVETFLVPPRWLFCRIETDVGSPPPPGGFCRSSPRSARCSSRNRCCPSTELPGLGVTVDEDAVRAADRDAHRWRNPAWRHYDGSLAEW